MDEAKPLSVAQRLQRIGIKKSTAYSLATKRHSPTLAEALRIYHQAGVALGVLEGATPEQIAALETLPAAEQAA